MQTVNILSHNGREYGLFLQLGELLMRGVRLRRNGIGQNLIAVEAIEVLRLALKKSMTEHLLGRIVVFLIVKSVHAAEIRYPALRRNTRSAEEYERARLQYYLRKFVFHMYPSVSL